MALLFDANGEYVNHGAGSSVEDMSSLSIVCWVYPTAVDTGYRPIISKYNDAGADGWNVQLTDKWNNANPNSIYATRAGTTWQEATSPNNQITLNIWTYIGVGFPTVGSAAPHMVYGTLTTRAAAITEQLTNAGASVSSDAGVDMMTGDITDGGDTFRGPIAMVGLFNVNLTDAQMIMQQYRIDRPIVATANCVGWFNYLDASTIADWSGHGNNGTVTNATVAAHVPLPLFPNKQFMGWKTVSAGPTLSIAITPTDSSYWKQGVRIVG